MVRTGEVSMHSLVTNQGRERTFCVQNVRLAAQVFRRLVVRGHAGSAVGYLTGRVILTPRKTR